ncbi:uncharacterized protein [Coffea arabica]|uniref:MULE transposase domain-containing protein n=1 Tax=Coffea arabica TaxID=13443 RepID=A0ABM4U657_COFAR
MVHKELNVNITKDQVYKTFAKAKILIHGKYRQQCTRIWDYCEKLLSSNPGSTVHVETEIDEDSGKERFHRLYICFAALKKGFKEGYSPVLGVDGCHLREPHPGVLLTTVGIDANDCTYSVAHAVVETKNKMSWKWFIEFLKFDLKIHDHKRWTFISDRQKGLGSAIQEILPGLEHRHCVRHLHNNFIKHHLGETLKGMFWACARSSYVNKFESEMEVLRFEVTPMYGSTFVVDLKTMTYAHLKAYEPAIGPINGPNNWKRSKKVLMYAPKKLKLHGKPEKTRRRELDEPIPNFKEYRNVIGNSSISQANEIDEGPIKCKAKELVLVVKHNLGKTGWLLLTGYLMSRMTSEDAWN